MLVLISFDCEAIVCEEGTITVVAIPEVNLIIGLNVVKFSCFEYKAFV